MFFVEIASHKGKSAFHTTSRSHADQIFNAVATVLRYTGDSSVTVEVKDVDNTTLAIAFVSSGRLSNTSYEPVS